MNNNPEAVITSALVKENVTEQVIGNLKGYLSLKITDIYDKKALAEVNRARIECKNLRVLAVKICKAGREESQAITKAWLTEEKRVVGQISEVEDYLAEQEQFALKEAERIDFENEQKAKLPERVAKMESIGIMPKEDFLLTLNDEQFTSHFNTHHSLRLEEQARIQREETENIEREKKDLAKKKFDSRMKELHALEMKFNGSMFIILDTTVSTSEIEKMTDDEFAGLVLKLTPMVEKQKQLDQEKHDEEIERAKEQARKDEAHRIDTEAAQKSEAERIQKEKDEKAAAAKPDKEKLHAFAKMLSELPAVILTTKEAKETLAKVESLLTEAINLLNK